MPQLDATTFPPQLIWLALTFFILLFLMAKVALPPITQTIAKRTAQIEGDLESASKLRAEIDIVVQAYERALTDAGNQAAQTVAATRDRLAQIAAEKRNQSIEAITQRTKIAEAEIARAKSAALSDIRSVASDAARAATERLLGQAPNEAQLSATIDAVLQKSA